MWFDVRYSPASLSRTPSKSGSTEDKKFWEGAIPLRVPQPLMPHGAGAALDSSRGGDAAERGGNHIAVLKGGGEVVSLVRVVAQPVQQLGEAPLMRIDAAAPCDGLEVLLVRERGDFRGFVLCAVIAPEIVVIERLHRGVDEDDARSGGVESDGFDAVAVDTGLRESVACGAGERGHLIGVGLGRLNRDPGVSASAGTRLRLWPVDHGHFQPDRARYQAA